jgi:hypothetical protein
LSIWVDLLNKAACISGRVRISRLLEASRPGLLHTLESPEGLGCRPKPKTRKQTVPSEVRVLSSGEKSHYNKSMSVNFQGQNVYGKSATFVVQNELFDDGDGWDNYAKVQTKPQFQCQSEELKAILEETIKHMDSARVDENGIISVSSGGWTKEESSQEMQVKLDAIVKRADRQLTQLSLERRPVLSSMGESARPVEPGQGLEIVSPDQMTIDGI